MPSQTVPHGDPRSRQVTVVNGQTSPAAIHGAYGTFLSAGGPGPERYGVTIDADAQRVWLDSPRGPDWNLTH
ncbi:hypothetical protein GKJPGBOP_05218 [Streptomyces paromomycinus]|uniref:Uncharacterized protein n=1 Tax=Streptomyces paromomycinus TaxID=92743 RepID=A0A401W837_STREY|nr:hypothetical protein GKJPGBOP_05218 [Streptomyces paromomycinus]